MPPYDPLADPHRRCGEECNEVRKERDDGRAVSAADTAAWRNRAEALGDLLVAQAAYLHRYARHGRRGRCERGIVTDWRDCAKNACHTTRLLVDSVRAALRAPAAREGE